MAAKAAAASTPAAGGKTETPAAGGNGDGTTTTTTTTTGDGKTKTGDEGGAGGGDGTEGEGSGAGAGAGDGKTKEGKGKEGAKGEGDGTEGSTSTEQGAPEKYELTIPDDGILDERDRVAIEAYARANNLTNDDAQALLEEHAGQLRTQSETWLNETKKDKTYGGEKLAETQKLARSAIDRIRPEGHPRRDAFRALLNKGGIMNHIEVVSFLADLGRQMGEDGGVGGGAGGGKGKKSLEQKLYTHSSSQVEGTDE